MPITHPSMRRAKSSSEQQPKQEVHVVDDATNAPVQQSMPETIIPNEVLNPTPPPRIEKPKPEPKRTNILEELLFLGRTTKEVKIGNITFEISTLTQKETSTLLNSLYNSADPQDLFTIRVFTLAYVVKSVNGTRLEDIPVEDDDYENTADKCADIISNMQKHIVEKLHDEYLKLVEESGKLLEDPETQEELKN